MTPRNIRINILEHYNRFNIEVSSEVNDENRRSETHNYLCAVTADNGASLYNVTNAQKMFCTEMYSIILFFYKLEFMEVSMFSLGEMSFFCLSN